MEITRQRLDNIFELKAKGRLDAYWAGHLADEVAEVLREGARSIRLNMKEVDYVSSAGIRVLFQTYKQLKGSRKRQAATFRPPRLRKRRLLSEAMRGLRFSKAAPVK
jgi:anti-anti-sigma factor